MATTKAAAKTRQREALPEVTATTVAVRETSTAVAPISERLKAHSLRQREELGKAPDQSMANMLSFRGGAIMLDKERLNSPLPVVILATQFERVFYPGAYSADEKTTPSCYSRDNIAPDEKAPFKQNPTCKDCPWNQFESAREGKGKGCKEGLKLAMVIPTGDKVPARVVQARLSVMNAMAAKSELAAIQRKVDHTVQAYVDLHVTSDPKTQYKTQFTFQGFVPENVLEQLEPMIDGAQAMLVQPYPTEMAVDPGKQKAAAPKRTVRKF